MAYKGTISARMGRNWVETTEQIRPITQEDNAKLHISTMGLSILSVKEIASQDGNKLFVVPTPEIEKK